MNNCAHIVEIMGTVQIEFRFLLLVGIIGFSIESVYYDDLEEILSSGPEITSYDEEQHEMLRINNNSTNAPTINTEHNNSYVKSCGLKMECVPMWLCKTSSKNQNGMYSIQYQQLYTQTECNYDQVCCHISDKIEEPLEPEKDKAMGACGIRNPFGVRVTLEGKDRMHFESNFGEFPWMVAIMWVEKIAHVNLQVYIGGGSLLAPNVVLTAGHKVVNKMTWELSVRVGEWDRSQKEEIYKHQDIQVKQIIVHEHFENMMNNIALLVLKKNVEARPHIAPICLPSFNENFDHSLCTVTGWGKEAKCRNYPNILKSIALPVLPRIECNDRYRSLFKNSTFTLEQGTICAGGLKNEDACYGDGGAPLVCPIKGMPNRYYQAGIVTWGINCGLENVPAAYTNVAHYNTWITEKLNMLNVESKYYTP